MSDKSKNQAGKGDKPRPRDQKKWEDGWNRIWGHKKGKTDKINL